jgi:putative transcriptional regulator
MGSPDPAPEGLAGLRRSGSVTELLFLYECATLEPTQLRPVAERLGLTVQAASHTFRALRRRGLVDVRDGRYRPTVEGIAWLHGSLTGLGQDLADRIDRLHVIRSTRAVAAAELRAGEPVSLEMRAGVLTARPGGAGPSRGRAARAARRGELAEVEELDGIVRLAPGTVSIRTLSEPDLRDPALPRRIAAALPGPEALLGAEGLAAFHAVSAAADRVPVRFAVAAAAREAARLGVNATVFVDERELPRLVAAFGLTDPPRLDVLPLGRDGRGRRARR